MSIQVSYKKQFLLGLMLLIVLLAVIELFANIYLEYIYRCDFEDNEIFTNGTVSEYILRNLCKENLHLAMGQVQINPHLYAADTREEMKDLKKRGLDHLITINSEGFRSPEFTKEKLPDMSRIFVLGGSATFGSGVFDNQTYQFYLQQLYDKTNLDFKVEVINAGWPAYSSKDEVFLVKSHLLEYSPDLLIVYDGINDIVDVVYARNFEDLDIQFDEDDLKFKETCRKEITDSSDWYKICLENYKSSLQWKERWKDICDLGNQYGYDTIISLQPTVSSGSKKLTEQEVLVYERSSHLNVFFIPYIDRLEELKNHCSLTVNLMGLFDEIQEPIFFDKFHTGPKGNQIIAEKFYELSLPIITSKTNHTEFNNNYQVLSNDKHIYNEFYKDLKGIISFYKTPKIIPLIFQ